MCRKCPKFLLLLSDKEWKLHWRELLDYTRERLATIQFSTSLVQVYPYSIKEVVTVGWATALQDRMSRVRFPIVSLEFFIDIILPAALRPKSTQPLTEISGIFPGGKGGWCLWLTTLPPSCVDCLEIWEPQAPRTLRACPRDCLPSSIKETKN